MSFRAGYDYRELRRAIANYDVRVSARMEGAVADDAAGEVLRLAKANVRSRAYDTGDLFRSLRILRPRGQGNLRVVVAGGVWGRARRRIVDYAVHVHEGTYKMLARPFLRDALLAIIRGTRVQTLYLRSAERELRRG